MKNFKQGESAILDLPVNESTPVDFSASTIIRVVLNIGNQLEVKKYSLASLAGYGVLEVDASLTNQINVFVTREDSVNFPVGNIQAVILVQNPNTDFPDGVEVKTYVINAGRVSKGYSIDEDMA